MAGEALVAPSRISLYDNVVLTMADDVHIYGGFKGIGVEETARTERHPKANETVLDGDDDDDLIGDVYHVVVGALNATLDGFTVTRGNATGIDPENWLS